MEEKLLQDIGLTEGETKVYFALLKSGTTKTGPLALAAGVSHSKVYKILGRLEKKGLAGHVLKGDVKYFSAASPRRILDYIDEKQKEFSQKREKIEGIIPELEKQQLAAKEKSEAFIFEGFRGIENFYKNILNDLKAGDTYYVIGAGYRREEVWPKMRDFFYMYHSRRAKKRIFVKMLANHNERGNLVKPNYLNAEVRFLPEYLTTDLMMIFYKSKTFLAVVTTKPVGFLLESEEAVRGFRAYFEALWKIAKP